MDELRNKFNARVKELIVKKKNNSFILTKEKYKKLCLEVNEIKKKTFGKKPEEYRRLKRYDVLKIDGVEKLVSPVKTKGDSILYFVNSEELFDIIHDTHLLIGHGGRNRMLGELKKKYKNITIEEIMIYLKLCEICQKKSKVQKKGVVVKPVIFKEMNSRCQVDLIDMQSQPDDDYKFIFVYQDVLTKFVQLRPLKSKTPKEVADNLIDIFTTFGAPSVLQSDNGREFSSLIVEEACAMWPNLKIVHGKPKHSHSQGFVDVENILSSWLEDNQTTRWSKGLRFVQLMKNMAFHEGIKCSPYEAMFGTPAKIGLKTSFFPNESVKHLRTEEELEALCDSVESIRSDVEDCLDDTSDSVMLNADFSNDILSETKIKIEEPEILSETKIKVEEDPNDILSEIKIKIEEVPVIQPKISIKQEQI